MDGYEEDTEYEKELEGEGGQNVWQECKQPATEEKQAVIIEHLEKMIGLLELLLPGIWFCIRFFGQIKSTL